MAKDWDRYKGEIHTLYIAKGRPLDDVRRILKGRHRFDASWVSMVVLMSVGMGLQGLGLEHIG
jgi:hypothetical protein